MPTKKPEEVMTFDSKEAAEEKMKELDEIYDTLSGKTYIR